MKPLKFSIFFAVLLRLTSAQALETIYVQVDDLAGLKQAITEANERPLDILTLIRFSHGIAFPEEESLPPIKARINFEGSWFYGHGGGPDRLFVVESTGIFGVRDTVFTDWTGATNGPVLFENHGTLLLRRVLFDSVLGYPNCSRTGCTSNNTAVIQNAPSGDLTLDDVLVIDSKITNPIFTGPENRFLANEGIAKLVRTQFYLRHERAREPIFNAGIIRMRNVSFMVRNPIDVPTLSLLAATEDASAQVVNSVFDGFTGDWCGLVKSAGHNTTTARDCNWVTPGDAVGVPTGLIFRRRYPYPERNDFDLVPSAASSVLDSANPTWCPEGYEIWDGDGDGVAVCDRGARELVPTSLAEGGINGFYYNPDEDGHYVYVQQTDFTTLVMWNTFDADGNQAWIYGTGELVAGKSVIAEAYINRTGGLTPDGLITDVQAEPWGELQVDMDSCTKGVVTYRSALPEFGSGQFPIERLAYVKQLGCVDPQ